ncbi:MAG: hypothetical protein BWX64_01607 [Acidobacteria bacterium ADurb.Bin051]|nr:MAG: hypothetical protein BWX64_01607 [Acidobacteria bacterium ADurb.Bin051]
MSHRTEPTDPKSQQPTPLYLAPEESLAAGLVEGGESPAYECVVLRPQDLTATHGVEIRPEHLQLLADSYDPKVEEATLNFDHAWEGPAHGFAEKLWVKGQELWARFTRLSQEAVEAIRSGRWPRRSSEFVRSHPATGDWYYTGCALLGAQRPAIWGMGQGHLLSGSPVEVVDLGSPATDPAAADPKEDPPMPIQLDGEPEPVSAPEPETLAAPDDQVTKLQTELAAERARSRRLEARARAAADVATLGTRVTPAMLRAGLPALLEELAAAESPKTVTLAAGDGEPHEATVYDALLDVLRAAPEAGLLASEPLAGRAAEEAARLALDTRTPEERAICERHGISPERAVELRRKFPRAFANN